jgi:sugar phosphate isomerase/epimerase
MTLGYCMNVHPGETLDEACAALEGPVKRVRALAGEVGAGLYLGARAAREVTSSERALDRLRAAVASAGVRVFTANAFPYGGFHGASVKRTVYRPTWEEDARLAYTVDVARVLARLLPEGASGSISTLPVAFGEARVDGERAGERLLAVASELERIAREEGRELALAIEPEPLCLVQRADELVSFLEEHVFPRDEAVARRRIGACLDACHHAVVFEEIEDALATYERAGVRVAKAQLSSALLLGRASIPRLRDFAEPRYLHQTFWRRAGAIHSAPDIESAFPDVAEADEARSHFHVPLAWEGSPSSGLGTTRPLLERALPAIARATSDLEVETYTWSVLPARERARFGDDVSTMVAAELAWVRGVLGDGTGRPSTR